MALREAQEREDGGQNLLSVLSNHGWRPPLKEKPTLTTDGSESQQVSLSRTDRRSGIVVGLTVIAMGLLTQSLLRPDYFVGLFNDDAGYLQKAWSLVFSERCPVCSSVIEPTLYRIGWPLVLAPVAYFAEGHLEAYRLLSVSLTIVAALFAADLCRREFGSRYAVALAAVFFLSPVTLTYGNSLMSEPLYCAILMALVWSESHGRSRRYELVKWILVLACFSVRSEGIGVALAFLTSRGWKKNWKFGLLYPSLFLACVFILRAVSLSDPAAFAHLNQTTDVLASGFSKSEYLAAGIRNQVLLVGRSFFYASAWIDRTFGIFLVGLFLFGLATSLKQRQWIGSWLLFATGAALIIWPYLEARYWMATLALWVLVALWALPTRARVAFLIVTLGFQTYSLALYHGRSSRVERTHELYQRLQSLGPKEVVSSTCPIRVHMVAHRSSETFQGAESLGPIARNLAARGASVLIWEGQSGLLTSTLGSTQFQSPKHLDLWLTRSTLFEALYENEAGVIVRLVTPKEKLEQAFGFWAQANSAPSLELRKKSLREGLKVLPDLPELRVLWIFALLETRPFQPDQASDPILAYFRQYPHDFPVGQMVVQALQQLGSGSLARQVAGLCYQEAVRLGDVPAQQAFSLGR